MSLTEEPAATGAAVVAVFTVSLDFFSSFVLLLLHAANAMAMIAMHINVFFITYELRNNKMMIVTK
jgi:hypothetical protein